MLEPPRTVESITLELAALRIVDDLKSNLIVRMADALYASPEERDLLAALQAEHAEVAAFAAGLAAPLPPAV